LAVRFRRHVVLDSNSGSNTEAEVPGCNNFHSWFGYVRFFVPLHRSLHFHFGRFKITLAKKRHTIDTSRLLWELQRRASNFTAIPTTFRPASANFWFSSGFPRKRVSFSIRNPEQDTGLPVTLS
jgi:hypothetical protein